MRTEARFADQPNAHVIVDFVGGRMGANCAPSAILARRNPFLLVVVPPPGGIERHLQPLSIYFMLAKFGLYQADTY
jgi:hypothetical protein